VVHVILVTKDLPDLSLRIQLAGFGRIYIFASGVVKFESKL